MLKISYASRLALYAALVLIGALLSTSGIIAYTASTALRTDAERSVDTGLETLRDLLVARSGSQVWSKRADGLYAGEVRIDGDTQIVDAVRRAIGGNATIFSGPTRVATSVQKPDGSRAVGTELKPGPVYDTVLAAGKTYRGEAEILGTPYLTIYEPIRDTAGTVIGILYVGIPQSALIATVNGLYGQIAVAVAVATLLGGAIMYAVLRTSIRPLNALIAVMTRLREGDLAVSVPMTDRHDTLGDMARSIGRFHEGLIEQDAMRRAAAGEAERAAQARRDASHALADNLERQIGAVVAGLQNAAGVMSESVATATAIGSAAEDKATAVAGDSQQTAQNVQLVASASEEMAASIAEVSERTLRSAEATRTAAGAMASVESTMTALSEATTEIGSVMAMINTIATQTNLLALNATIEAARAGEAGRGFAVVATEVKDLARRSKQASEEVSDRLAQMRTSVGTAVTTMEQMVRDVRGIDEDMGAIAASVQQQRAATAEISRSVTYAATGMQSVASGIRAMQADVSRTAEVIRGTDALARDVTAQGQTLKATMQDIVGHLRAA